MVPQSRAFPVLITRPEPQATRFAKAVTDRYGAAALPILSPLLAAAYLRPALPPAAMGSVVFTSETAVLAAAALDTALPTHAFCVGDRTAAVAAQHGFTTSSADADAEGLFQLLLQNAHHAPFLHLRGEDTRGDLVSRLVQAGLPAQDAVVYRQTPAPLTTQAKTLLQGSLPVIVPLFSPRTAQVLRAACDLLPPLAPLILIALSPAIAAEVPDMPQAGVAIARHPTQAELFRVMDSYIINA